MNGIIYIAKNKINGKHYVGQSIQKWPQRKKDHINYPQFSMAIDNAIIKYGKEKFKWEIVESRIKTQKLLNFFERFYITHYNSNIDLWGYNIREGGSNGKMSEETKRKMSLATRGINNPIYGKKRSEETKHKISEAHIGKKLSSYHRKMLSIGQKKRCEKYGPPMLGETHSAETKKKYSETRKGKNNPMYGVPSPMTGKKHSEESKLKMSQAVKGENNGNYGKEYSFEERLNLSRQRRSKYLGTTYKKGLNPEKRCWGTQIVFNKHHTYLGYYEDPFSGDLVYKLVWEEIWGQKWIV